MDRCYPPCGFPATIDPRSQAGSLHDTTSEVRAERRGERRRMREERKGEMG